MLYAIFSMNDLIINYFSLRWSRCFFLVCLVCSIKTHEPFDRFASNLAWKIRKNYGNIFSLVKNSKLAFRGKTWSPGNSHAFPSYMFSTHLCPFSKSKFNLCEA